MSSLTRPAALRLSACALVLVLGACGSIPPAGAPTFPTGADRASPPSQTSRHHPVPEPSLTAPPSTPTTSTPTTSTPAGEPRRAEQAPRPGQAVIRQVPTAQWMAMTKAGMVRAECPVTKRQQLRRVDVAYVDFNGETRRGHLIVRSDTAASTARIFTQLFKMRFPIRRMEGVEAYGGDVYESLKADNTSAYNCRRRGQINAPFVRSPHANGRAVDINPVENPWKDLRCRCWSPSGGHAARTEGPGKILKNDQVWQLFDDEGWIWQNIDVPDYMHFDTGYPSKPYQRR